MKRIVTGVVVCTLGLTLATPAQASHSWNGYHWARRSNPFSLALVDEVNSTWNPYLTKAASDWTAAAPLNTVVASGNGDCGTKSGRVEVCNGRYGYNGWLGIARVWLNGSHIVQAKVKLNDTYFNQSYYDRRTARQHVICQEVGHTLGLDHQHVSGTCMNDGGSSLFDAASAVPNAHDYEELAIIYNHSDSYTSVAPASAGSSLQVPGAFEGVEWVMWASGVEETRPFWSDDDPVVPLLRSFF